MTVPRRKRRPVQVEPNPGERSAAKSGLMTVEEAARFLGLSVWTIRRWIFQRRIPYVKLGRAVRIDREDLDALVERARVEPGRYAVGDGGEE